MLFSRGAHERPTIAESPCSSAMLPVAAGAFVVAVAWLNPFSPGPSFAAVSCLLGIICTGVLGLWMRHIDAAAVARSGLLLAALISSVMALLQYTGVAGPLAPWVNAVSGAGEAVANLRQPNQLATLTSIGLVTVIFGGWKRGGRAVKTLSVVAVVVLAFAAAASASRTGLVQWILIPALWWTWRERHASWNWRDGLVLSGPGFYILAAIALPWATDASRDLVGRLSDNNLDCSSRLVLWSNVVHLISLKPWTGWGWGELDYAHFVTLYPGTRFCAILDNAHNLPLHLAVELGIPFAAFVVATGSWLVWRARPWRETDRSRQLAWSVLAVILIHSMVEYPLWYGPFQMTVVLCLIVLARPEHLVRPRAVIFAIRFAAATSIVVTAWVAWEYWCSSQIYLPPHERMATWRADPLTEARRLRFFRGQTDFAKLTLNQPTAESALEIYALAERTLHYSPEPKVIEALVQSALMLQREEDAFQWLIRYRAAFPVESATFLASGARQR